MNAPNAPFLPALPPLSHHPAAGTARRIDVGSDTDGASASGWEAGFDALPADPQEPFSRACDPTPLDDPQWLAISDDACRLAGLTASGLVESHSWLDLLSGCAAGSHLQPYAAVYAGHQFGVFVPRLGDGRAINIGARRGWELQLKGAGPTPYARHADGRAVLRSSIREFLCSEAMHALGIPTTRAMSLVISPSPVMREQIETAAVVCRMAPSFVRFGSFEYFSSRSRPDALETLARSVWPVMFSQATLGDAWSPERHREAIDEASRLTAKELAQALLEETARRTARLMARWMEVGFMHGVMNTDNFSILGLTLDYGPFGFMDAFDAGHICNHSDHSGRYSYQAQPQVGLWNVSRLGAALHTLIGETEPIQRALQIYRDTYAEAMQTGLRAKLGLQGIEAERWDSLLDDLYGLMHAHRMDHTLTFRSLSQPLEQGFLDLAKDPAALEPWLARYRQAASDSAQLRGISNDARQGAMRRVNPRFVLRNWIAEEVIRSVRDQADSAPLATVFGLLRAPFDEHPGHERYAEPPPDWACGLSVSCSS